MLLWILPWDPTAKLFSTLVIGGVWGLITVYGVFSIQANWFTRSIHHTQAGSLAITFDDGPHPELTEKILSILDEHGIKATFFLIGKQAEKYPHLVKKIIEKGHGIGNHSYSHSKYVGFFSVHKLKNDLQKCTEVLEGISGKKIELFRPPFGVTNPRYAKVLPQLRLKSIGWSLRSYDTISKDAPRLLKRLQSKIRPGQILLLHDTVPITAQILPDLIQYCKERKISIVKIEP